MPSFFKSVIRTSHQTNNAIKVHELTYKQNNIGITQEACNPHLNCMPLVFPKKIHKSSIRLILTFHTFFKNTIYILFASLTAEFVPLVCHTAGIYEMVEL